jgi:hypothetical protein
VAPTVSSWPLPLARTSAVAGPARTTSAVLTTDIVSEVARIV